MCENKSRKDEERRALRHTQREISAALGQTELENGSTETGASREDWNTHPLTFIYMSCIYINGVVLRGGGSGAETCGGGQRRRRHQSASTRVADFFLL